MPASVRVLSHQMNTVFIEPSMYDYDYDYIMAPQRGRPYGANLGSMGRNTGTWSIRSECLSNITSWSRRKGIENTTLPFITHVSLTGLESIMKAMACHTRGHNSRSAKSGQGRAPASTLLYPTHSANHCTVHSNPGQVHISPNGVQVPFAVAYQSFKLTRLISSETCVCQKLLG